MRTKEMKSAIRRARRRGLRPGYFNEKNKLSKRYAIYGDEVSAKDKYKVPNFDKLTLYKTKEEAKKQLKKSPGDKVLVLKFKNLKKRLHE